MDMNLDTRPRYQRGEDGKLYRQVDVSSDVAAEIQPIREGETPLEATCVGPECSNPAPYSGAWCDECQSRREDEQRAKARTERKSINVRRGL